MSNEYRRTISLSTETYFRLKDCGNFGESFNDLINRLLDFFERDSQPGEDV
jgi:predicted CopG family antitoxin